jgi:cell fate (sporulation/competence/biofilm development) regulator YlbF (YheA/YmcA/DUF963 family)
MSLDPETAAPDTDAGESVDSLATTLGQAITDLPEYEAFLSAKERVEADEAAQERIREFERLRDEYVTARETGRATEDALRTLQEAQDALHDLPVMSDYLEAQSALELRLQALNQRISDPLAVDFGEKAGGCCQD